MDPTSAPPRRATCPRCQRPASACLCALARPARHQAQVLILMHPLEVGHAKGTGRLLHLCLPHSRVLVGEAFEPQALAQALAEPWNDADRAAPRRALLLYPPAPPGGPLPAAPAPPLPADWLAEPARLRLVVLDATWRKSRKMLWANPALQRLPRLALHGVPASRYAIRKAHAPHQLSTLEATQLALQKLEPGNTGLATLGEAMDAFVAGQRALWPAAMLGASNNTP
ncbi:tRNA-uridine aminocarboxypropyltransferase [Pulveribacter sp.]|uniref:tRNA-uridine aminocarboxypropyltransferase n=1 Tax=Pulveribacter sp. TaxID=2678893 RepID=UPI0028AB6A1F|nr:tRNA-uridine aminocarboxypropyltransferase [Pulveribacter sp.]